MRLVRLVRGITPRVPAEPVPTEALEKDERLWLVEEEIQLGQLEHTPSRRGSPDQEQLVSVLLGDVPSAEEGLKAGRVDEREIPEIEDDGTDPIRLIRAEMLLQHGKRC